MIISLRAILRLTTVGAVVLMTVSNTPCFSQAIPPQNPSKNGDAPVKEQNIRLQNTLDLSANGISMQDLCVRFAKATQTPFFADAGSRDLKFTVRCHNRKAQEIMDALAEMVPGKWESESTGYVFHRDKPTLNQSRTWWRLFEMERATWRAGVVQRFNREFQDTFSLIGKPMPAAEKEFGAKAIADTETGYKVWRSLPYSAIEAVIGQVDDLFLYQKFPLMARVQPSGGVFLSAMSLSQDSKRLLQANSDRFPFKVDYRNFKGIWLYNYGMDVSMNAVLADGTFVSVPPSFGPPSVSNPISVRLDQRFLANLVQQFDATPPKGSSLSTNPLVQAHLYLNRPTALWRRLVEIQLRRFWGEPQKQVPPQGDPVPPRLADQCDRIATDYKADIIADYFSGPERLLSSNTTPKKKTLEDALGEITDQHDASSKVTPSGIVLVRNNRWYRDEALEVSPTLISEIVTRKAALVAPPTLDKNQAALFLHLEMTALALQKLTLWQIANGFRYYVNENAFAVYQAKDKKSSTNWAESNAQPFADVAATIFAHYKVCRFYAALSSSEREQLITTGLPIPTLSAEAAQVLFDLNIDYRLNRQKAGKVVRLRSQLEGFARTIIRNSAGETYSDTFGNQTNGAAPYYLDLVVEDSAQ